MNQHRVLAEFACGCIIPQVEAVPKDRTGRRLCPVHGEPIIGKISVCGLCGEETRKDKRFNTLVACTECRRKGRKLRYPRSKGAPPRPPDPGEWLGPRKSSCAYYDDCLNAVVMNGIRPAEARDCRGCERYVRREKPDAWAFGLAMERSSGGGTEDLAQAIFPAKGRRHSK